MNKPEKKGNRRDFIFTASYTVGAIGIGATLWPLIDQMNPDTSVKALASTEVDISQIEPGKSVTVLWRGKPVFIKRRTQEEIVEAQSVNLKELPHPEKDQDRAKKPEWLVMLGICTHLGCVPLSDKENIMVGFVLVMDHIMIHLEELEKVQPQLIWKFPNILLLTIIQLRLIKKYE